MQSTGCLDKNVVKIIVYSQLLTDVCLPDFRIRYLKSPHPYETDLLMENFA